MSNNHKYYIIVDGEHHEGPMTFEEIIAHPAFSPMAPVWRDGLTDWAEVQIIVDFADHFAAMNPPVEDKVPPYSRQSPEPAPGQAGGFSSTPGPMPEWWYADSRREAKMPSNYLAFAIIVTLCCCIPTGVVAIIYSSKVSSAFYRGEYDKAQSCSDNALLWCIISLVLGLMCMPLVGVMNLIISSI